MVFKLDLDKAYHRVNWNFLKDTLVKFKFPPTITSLIMFDGVLVFAKATATQARVIDEQACSTVFGSTQTTTTQSSNPRLVTWARPMEGTICLNVDGSLLGSLNSAGYGGLLRNHNNESILFAEIMVVLHGLTICWENGYRKINCLSDSLQLITLDWKVVLSHTLREGNSCADVLAKMGVVANTPLVTTSTPPRTLAKPLFKDANGVIFTMK
ncbi:hypothetical protein TSUD_214800 [Trifolium subterraneum]|uniref:RNase H type-1 domain-containing protein n=1 Tax=Trifolium subterraneum TaxID=3900 RepID=A0A2Z6MEI7_TRISU|nr:hypothetical protein TSUD_214800 [Trifolium subterraneum]